MTDKPGKLMDAGTIMAELGIKRNAADVLMRQLPKVQIPGLQKNFVRRSDVEKLLEENTLYVMTARGRRRMEAA